VTEANRLENARLEWERALVCRREAEGLRDLALWNGSISRAYYAMFHMARSLLMTAGVEVRSHGGLLGELGLHLVQPGLFPAEQARTLGRLQRMRADADYLVSLGFTDADAETALRLVDEFSRPAVAYLRSRGLSL